MDPNQQTEDTEYEFELTDDETAEVSVDDFIRELEAKEKDLHITADTTFIEIASEFDEGEIPDFMKQELAKSPTKMAVKPSVASAPDSAAVKKLENEVADLKTKIAGLQEERTELYKNSQRRLKDFEAYKSRTERERGDTFQRQLRNLATQMLPALDNLDRAIQCASDMSDEKQAEFAQFFDGIVLVNQQVNEVLVNMGIDPILTIGHPFDPHLHEAVAIDEDSELPPNTITAELLRGFRIGDTVIRHSMVKVSKAATRSDEGATEPAGQDADLTATLHQMSIPDEDEIVEFETLGDEVAVAEFEIERNGSLEQEDED